MAATDRAERRRESGAPAESGSPNPVNINGQRTKANLFMLDGISTTSSAQGRGNNFNIPLEAVREFSVQAGAYSAEYGNVAGGVINLESKSGSNEWHGSLFEFFRNDQMDAANFFANATSQPKNPLRYNQFGGSLGRADSAREDFRLCRLPGHDHPQRRTDGNHRSAGCAAAGRFFKPASQRRRWNSQSTTHLARRWHGHRFQVTQFR